MKIILNQSEIDSVVEYIRAERSNPCKGCRDINVCCGCPKQKEYSSAMKKLEQSTRGLLSITTLVAYAETIVAMENNLNQVNKLKEEYERLNAECMRLKGLLCIENDSEEKYT